ncbi:glycosyltransferase family 2 protein [Silvanigrella aquatica]|uniref:Glycosyltransferase 2-like domain-containing protein n=1 Tax=Silvanigrella aquatica TaxID=1915309 RepID=A0A1L4D310_9BACT|nr:glycosyltransferase family 2 protein [Silvanigrella aquatica]APJ04595.1 hypothetical protein AXG55_12035 [Silvanigrella aquatica]
MFKNSSSKFFVSIIIPIYNDEDVIPRLINEVLIHYKNSELYEVIFIDDKSSDNSIDILNKLLLNNSYSNYKLILNQKNIGASATRNVGCKNAKGDYVAFLDSDDAWHKDKINIQIKLMQQTNSFISGTCHAIISPNRLKTEIDTIYKEDQIHFTEIKWPSILFKSPFCTPSVVIHRSVLDKYKFNENFRYSEDYDFWVRSSYEFKTIKILKNLTFTFKHDYLSNSNSLSSNLYLMQKALTLVRFNLIKDQKYSIIYKILIITSIVFEYFKFSIRFFKKFKLKTSQLVINRNLK